MPLPSSDHAVIQIRHVCFCYPRQTRHALSGIDLCVAAGEHVVVLGASGSGKSTLLRLIAGLLQPHSGSIEVRARVGLVLQDAASQIIGATVEEDVAFGPHSLGLPAKDISQRVNWALSVVEAEHLRERRPQTLSRGELQRIAVAGVIAMTPGILLLDEASAFLDVGDTMWLRDVIAKAQDQGVSVVEATHSLNAARHANRVLLLEGGRLRSTGSPVEILSDHSTLVQAGVQCRQDQEAIPARPRPDASHPPVLRLQPPLVPDALALRPGECLAIVGRSGSGKTTLALSLLGLDPSGVSLTRRAPTVSADKRLAVLFQEPEKYFWAGTVGEEIGIGRMSTHERRQLLAHLRLPQQYMERCPTDLSAGEQRRTALGAALAHKPHILVADEPTAGLDAPAHHQVVLLLNRWLATGGCLILVTRVRKHLRTLANYCVVMQNAQAVFCGPASTCLEESTLLITAGLEVSPP